MKKKRTYKSSIKHLVYNLKKLQYKNTRKGKKIPVDLCICRYRLEEYIKVISALECQGFKVTAEGMIWNKHNYKLIEVPLHHPLK